MVMREYHHRVVSSPGSLCDGSLGFQKRRETPISSPMYRNAPFVVTVPMVKSRESDR